MLIWHSRELSHHINCEECLHLLIIIITFKQSFINMVFMSLCKCQVIKGSSADMYTSIVLGSLYVSGWLYSFTWWDRSESGIFCHTFNMYYNFSCAHDSTSEMIWSRHTEDIVNPHWQIYAINGKKRELNCLVQWTVKNTCKL